MLPPSYQGNQLTINQKSTASSTAAAAAFVCVCLESVWCWIKSETWGREEAKAANMIEHLLSSIVPLFVRAARLPY